MCRSRRVYGFPREATCQSRAGFPRVSDHKQAPLWRSRTGGEASSTMFRKPRGTRSTSRSRVRGRATKKEFALPKVSTSQLHSRKITSILKYFFYPMSNSFLKVSNSNLFKLKHPVFQFNVIKFAQEKTNA